MYIWASQCFREAKGILDEEGECAGGKDCSKGGDVSAGRRCQGIASRELYSVLPYHCRNTTVELHQASQSYKPYQANEHA